MVDNHNDVATVNTKLQGKHEKYIHHTDAYSWHTYVHTYTYIIVKYRARIFLWRGNLSLT